MEAREKLLKLLYKNSFMYDSDKGFKLSCGAHSDVYFDCKKTSLTSEGLMLIGELFWEEIKNLDVEAIGGLTLGADSIVCATAMHAAIKGRKIDAFIVRKEAKKHGTQRWIEGNIRKGMKVVIVDDVVTTGASTLKAIQKAKEAGLEILKIVVLIDREEGGREAIERQGYEYVSIFTRSDFIRKER